LLPSDSASRREPTRPHAADARIEDMAMNSFNLHDHDLTVGEVHRNLPPSSLDEHAFRVEKHASTYHALVMHTMLIRPTRDELSSFGRPWPDAAAAADVKAADSR